MRTRALTWPQAAEDLARRVTRRERLGALLRPLGAALVLGSLLAVGLKSLGGDGARAHLLLAAGSLAGLLLGARAAAAVAAARAPHAAWALDRLAGARERGLTAATVTGPAASEAAWAAPRIAPPSVRLHPPRGLALLLGGVLAAVLALVAPTRSRPPSASGSGPGAAGPREAAAAALEARRLDRGARAAEDRARAAAAVREALGLTAQDLDAVDAARVAERLAEEAALGAALRAAAPGGELAALLAGGPGAAERVAQALREGREAASEALEGRRRAAALRAAAALAPVPAERRSLVARYFGSLPLRGAR